MIDDTDGQPEEVGGEELQLQPEDELPAGQDGTEQEEKPEGEAETEEQSEEEAKPKGKSVQERIDEITAARREAEREAEFWRNKALASQPQEQQQEAPQGPPEPSSYEFGEADPAYIRDMVRHEMRQELEQERQRTQLETQVAQLEQGYAERLKTAREEIPDYDDVVTKSAARGEWPCPPLVAIGIKESEVGPKVAHYLATNRDEAVSIANLSPIEQARAFGRLEARFLGQTAPQAKIATNAPEPAPARTKGGQFAPSNVLRDDLSQEEWLRRRNAQIRA